MKNEETDAEFRKETDAEFKIDDDIYLLKKALETAIILTGRFNFFFAHGEDMSYDQFEFTPNTEFSMSDNFFSLRNTEGDYHVYRIDKLVHFRRVLGTASNI